MTWSWENVILLDADSTSVWRNIMDRVREIAAAAKNAGELQRALVPADRLLAESAWELWGAYSAHAVGTVDSLKSFWARPTPTGKAILILDALSLRELPLLARAAEAHSVEPTTLGVTGSPIPADTDRFAREMGVPSRSAIANNRAPGGFIFASGDTYTDSVDLPFHDAADRVPTARNVVLWLWWPDKRLHECADASNGPAILEAEVTARLGSADFWKLVDALRQGRRLVITSDHGYAVSRLFGDEVSDKRVPEVFGQMRYVPDDGTWETRHLPPIVHSENGFLVVTGQRKWTVRGGFPKLCHGGMSLLEVLVPYVELPPI